MATYLMLFRTTQQGAQKMEEAPARIQAAKDLCRSLGGEVKQFHFLLGQYDAAFTLEAPNDETAAKIALAIGARGNVVTETLRAFTETEFKALVTNLP